MAFTSKLNWPSLDSNDDVPEGLANQGSKLVGEKTLLIKKSLQQSQNSPIQLNRPHCMLNLLKVKPKPLLDLELILMHDLDP